MSVLTKRESITAADGQFGDPKAAFFKQHLPELLDLKGRLKHFVDYEFPKKQGLLKKYWQRALSLFFRHALQGAVVYWEDLEEYLAVEGNYPLGLPRIIAELAADGELVLLSDELEFPKLERLLASGGAEQAGSSNGLWDRLRGFFGAPARPALQTGTLVVSVAALAALFNKAETRLPRIFADKRLLAEEEFRERCRTIWAFGPVDERAALALLLAREALFRRREHGLTFFFLPEVAREPEVEFEALTQEVLLERKLVLFDNKIDELSHSVERASRELLELKRQNRKDEAMALLRRRRGLTVQLEQLGSKRLLLHDMLIKLAGTRDERGLAEVLARTARLLEDHDRHFESLTDSLGDFQAFAQQQEGINQLISDMGNKSELEALYEDLEEPELQPEPTFLEPATRLRPIAQSQQPEPIIQLRQPEPVVQLRQPEPAGRLSESVAFRRQIEELLK